MPRHDPLTAAEGELRDAALAFPETAEDFPWGHRAIKVKGKAFIFMALEDDSLSLSVKLPASAAQALELPFTEPAGYGMGKHGWVTASFGPGDDVPMELVRAWLAESYRAVAPKKLAAQVP